MQRFMQITDSHCGAAVVQMLLSNIGIIVSQEEIAAAAGVEERIEEYGMRVHEMALAVRRLAPQAQFWYKDEAELEDLAALVEQYGYPVGVEWQGAFGQDEDDDDEDDDDDEHDYGHYSIATKVDIDEDTIVIVDPYRDFGLKDRYFSLSDFLGRWWDTNTEFDRFGRYSRLVEDYHMLFIVTNQGASFPKLMGMSNSWPEQSWG
jgi:hypothetical protein